MGESLDRPRIVVSAVNLFEGGPLSILRDCLRGALVECGSHYEIVALVHSKTIVGVPGICYIELPHSRRSWLHRLYYEYVRFRGISGELRPFLWLSLHDITPNVAAERRAVYCHNPAPFFRLRLRHVILDPRFAMFVLFYSWLYRINIRQNSHVIVQQEWMARKFRENFGLSQVLVARPTVPGNEGSSAICGTPSHSFVFPTFPRVFKNVEVLGEAAKLLLAEGGCDAEFLVTFDGGENRYARSIRQRYGSLPNFRLIGPLSRLEVFALYSRAVALVFPSLLETWGLPLTEFQVFQRPILAADLPYARETLGDFPYAKFFPAEDPRALARLVREVLQGTIAFDPSTGTLPVNGIEGWPELFRKLLAKRVPA